MKNMDMRFSARYVSPCRIYFICHKKVAIDFYFSFFAVIEDTVLIEIMK